MHQDYNIEIYFGGEKFNDDYKYYISSVNKKGNRHINFGGENVATALNKIIFGYFKKRSLEKIVNDLLDKDEKGHTIMALRKLV